MRIDLHTHSRRSDGTQTPTELVAEAATVGVDVLALTDHDTTRGWAEAIEHGDRVGVQVIPGLEFSTKHRGASMHLLAFRPEPHWFEPAFEEIRDSRVRRAQRMVERLAEDFPVSWSDVLSVAQPGATIGRPHIADALIAVGAFPDRDAAFADVLSPRSRYHVPHYSVELSEAIRLVRQAGGAPVLAHSLARRQRRPLDEELLEELVALGLLGLEVDHRDHDEAARERLRRWCSRFDLVATGGSDYHGTGKKNRLGENLTAVEAWQELDRRRSS